MVRITRVLSTAIRAVATLVPMAGMSVVGMPAAHAATLSGVAQVAAGANHSCAVTTAGGLWCWGANADGQLGLGDTTSRPNPTQVATSGYAEIQVSQPDIYGGFFDGRGSSCARKTDATVWCWGANGDGQLGDGTTVATTTPVQVQTASGALSGVTALTLGSRHACALKSDGTVWCWGENQHGALGLGDTTSRSLATQLSLTGVSRIAAGVVHTCAARSDGTVWCWGENGTGQLGIGTIATKHTPT